MPPPNPPRWLAELVTQVALCLQGSDFLAPLGCHFYWSDEDQEWEIALFASETEVVGGEYDGLQTYSLFHVDLGALSSLLSDVTEYSWQNLPFDLDDDLGAHISLRGTSGPHRVWVRILAAPPARFGSGRVFNVYDMKLEDLW